MTEGLDKQSTSMLTMIFSNFSILNYTIRIKKANSYEPAFYTLILEKLRSLSYFFSNFF